MSRLEKTLDGFFDWIDNSTSARVIAWVIILSLAGWFYWMIEELPDREPQQCIELEDLECHCPVR